MIWLKRMSWYLLLPLTALLLAAVLLLLWLLGTESGTDWALRKAAHTLEYDLQAQEISGTFLGGLSLRELELALPGVTLEIGAVDSEWDLVSTLGGTLEIEHLRVDGLLITTLPKEEDPAADDGAPSPWPTISPPLTVVVKELKVREVRLGQQGVEPQALGKLAFRGSLGPRGLRIGNLTYAHPDGLVAVAGRTAGRFPYRHKLAVRWQWESAGQQLAGAGTLAGKITGTRLKHRLTAPASAETSGTLGLDNRAGAMQLEPSQLTFDLANTWPGLPLRVGDLPLGVAGALTLKGSGDDYTLGVEATLEARSGEREPLYHLAPEAQLAARAGEFLPGRLELQADGSLQGLAIGRAELQTAGGRGNLAGDITWAEGLGWDLDLDMRQLNLAPLIPRSPAVVSGSVTSSGSLAEGDYRIAVASDGLNGTLRDFPAEARFAATLEPGRIAIDMLDVNVADNHVAAEGTLGQENSLSWTLDAPRLSVFGYGLEGALTSRGTVSGSPEKPVFDATIDGDNLSFGEWTLAAIDAELAAGGPRNLEIDAGLRGIEGPGLENASANLKASGTLADHLLRLRFEGADADVRLLAEGGYRELRWRGEIRELALEHPLSGPWQQRGDAGLSLAPGDAELVDLCLGQEASELCVRGGYSADGLSASGQLEALDLGRLETWLPPRTAITGTLGGTFAFTASEAGRQGSVSLETSGAEFSYRRGEDKRLSHRLTLAADGALKGQGLSLNSRLEIDDIARITATAATDLDAPRELSGRVDVTVDSLQWLEAFTAAVEDPHGELAGEIVLGGTLAAPRIDGELLLSDFGVNIPATGVTLRDGGATLAVAADGDWQLNGTVATEDGSVRISGEGETAELWQGNVALNLAGENLNLVSLPDTRVRVSPDIRISRDSEGTAVTGRLDIPYADITLKQLPQGAISPTGDEVIDPPLETQQSESNLAVDLEIGLGDNVHVAGYGLDTRLTGNMSLRRRPSGVINARGRIELRDGTFEGYGQSLKITAGHLIFQGNPENPGVNIRAVRETATADVGLRIAGTLQNFDTEIFSDPSLPPTDALVLLVTGKLPNSIDESEANLAVSAATALGLSQSDRITSHLQNAFGLDTLALEGGDTYEESSLVVGKQITPDLFVSYVQNLFSPASSFVLQYQLTERLGLKAESGEQHSIDVLYKIEH